MENTSVFIGHKQPILPKLQHCIEKAKKIYFDFRIIDYLAKIIHTRIHLKERLKKEYLKIRKKLSYRNMNYFNRKYGNWM